MIVSRKAMKKQAVRDERVCYLHARSNTTVEFVNSLNKPAIKAVA